MAFSKEQAELIKKQLLTQIESLPQENKEQIKKYIESLNESQLEEFLKQNKIQLSSDSGESEITEKCVFCSIIKNQIPSYKIAENKKSIAVLDINPLSKAHSIVIPLEHITTEKLPKSSLSLAQKIAKKIKKKFKPEDIKIETSSFQGHSMINIIPIYKDVPLKKSKTDESELRFVQSKLETKSRAKRTERIKSKKQEKINLPRIREFRIP